MCWPGSVASTIIIVRRSTRADRTRGGDSKKWQQHLSQSQYRFHFYFVKWAVVTTPYASLIQCPVNRNLGDLACLCEEEMSIRARGRTRCSFWSVKFIQVHTSFLSGLATFELLTALIGKLDRHEGQLRDVSDFFSCQQIFIE